MSYVGRLEHQEHLLRRLVGGWHYTALRGGDTTHLRERISRELAEAQMCFERHLAELPARRRAVERYRLEFEFPTFCYLKRWYYLFLPETTATEPPVRARA